MAKTESNSVRCPCCHRYMPRKAGKPQACSNRCRRVAQARELRELRGGQR